MEKEQTSHQPLFKNRLCKFKMKLGAINTKITQSRPQSQIVTDSPVKIRLRKASLNLKSFDSIDLKSQKSVKESFQEYYELEEKIGQGGHSVVYRCRRRANNNVYAVKFTRKNDPENLQNLKQQYRILVSLSHETIMKGFYLFLNQKKCTCHLVCEYFDFPNLKDFIVYEYINGMPEELAAQILLNILFGVEYLHSQKVCHRDLKPDNILYNNQTGQIKIIDFEIAKMPRYKHQNLQMWTKTGTPHYRSPEIYNGSYSESTDLWSIGIIAYEMLTGKLPFRGLHDYDLIKAICEKQPSYEDLEISNLALNFLKKLLVKDPKQRITAKEAISHPFILTMARNCSSPHKSLSNKLNNSFDEFVQQEDQSFYQKQKSKYYDQNMECSFTQTGQDIGIINCQEWSSKGFL